MQENIEIAMIINKHIATSIYNNGEILVNETDIDFNEKKDTIKWNFKSNGGCIKSRIESNDKLAEFLTNTIVKNRKLDGSTFYHYIPLEYGFNIIEHNELQFSSLSYLTKNDSEEYSEFLRRYSCNPAFNEEHISKAKDKIFIFCLTNKPDNQKFWDEYIKGKPGLCIGFKFEKADERLLAFFEFLDVLYDDTHNFDFINHIQEELYQKYCKRLFIGGINRIARHYKMSKYSWERETRLIFDFLENAKLHDISYYKGITGTNLERHLKPEFDEVNNRHFMKIKFDNPFYKIKIKELTYNKYISNERLVRIKSLLPKEVKVHKSATS